MTEHDIEKGDAERAERERIEDEEAVRRNKATRAVLVALDNGAFSACQKVFRTRPGKGARADCHFGYSSPQAYAAGLPDVWLFKLEAFPDPSNLVRRIVNRRLERPVFLVGVGSFHPPPSALGKPFVGDALAACTVFENGTHRSTCPALAMFCHAITTQTSGPASVQPVVHVTQDVNDLLHELTLDARFDLTNITTMADQDTARGPLGAPKRNILKVLSGSIERGGGNRARTQHCLVDHGQAWPCLEALEQEKYKGGAVAVVGTEVYPNGSRRLPFDTAVSGTHAATAACALVRQISP